MSKVKKAKRKANTYSQTCCYEKCGETFVCYNRSRKFCPDKNCKDCYYNDRKLDVYHRNKIAVKIAEKNRNVLSHFFLRDTKVVAKAELNQYGFVFDAFSKHHFTEQQIALCFGDVFDFVGFSLKNIGGNNFEIIKQ